MQPLPLLVAILFFILGIVGTVLPVLPGAALIWAGMFIYGLLTGFASLDIAFFVLQGMAVLLIVAVDYMAAAWGTRRFGGTRAAIWGAVVGLPLGILVLGPGGIIFGPFVGAFFGGLLAGLPPDRALSSSFGALIGLVGGLLLKLALEGVMIIWFFKNVLS